MMYKHPGPHFLHDEWFDYKVVPEYGIDEALAQGWYLTTKEALDNTTTKPPIEPEEVEKIEKKYPHIILTAKPETIEIKPIKKTNGLIAPKELTAELKEMIASADGTQRDIAKKFNVSTYTVHKIKAGKL